LDEWIVMPNHVHAIILIDAGFVGAVREPPVDGREKKIKPLGELVGAFKTVSSKKINQMRGTPGEIFWQRNYYEHVIRGENEL
jgi:putative transposase